MTIISKILSLHRRRFPGSTVTVFTVIVLGKILNCFRRDHTRGTLTTLGGVTSPDIQIRQSKHARRIPSRSLIPNSVILLRTKSRMPTSKQLLRSTGLRIHRSTLANRTRKTDGRTRVVLTRPAPLTSHGGLIFRNARILRKQTGILVAGANVGARLNHVTTVLRSMRGSPAPLRRHVSRLNGILIDNSLVLITVIIINNILVKN